MSSMFTLNNTLLLNTSIDISFLGSTISLNSAADQINVNRPVVKFNEIFMIKKKISNQRMKKLYIITFDFEAKMHKMFSNFFLNLIIASTGSSIAPIILLFSLDAYVAKLIFTSLASVNVLVLKLVHH